MHIDRIGAIHQIYTKQSSTPTKKINKTDKRDEVSLSENAKEFQNIYQKLKNVPDVREEKVDRIKEQLRTGTYNVNSEEVAEKILSSIDLRG